jgi:nicotinamide-nucleotide amidase
MTAAADVLGLLAECDCTLAVAESLTGGLVAAELAGVPGASRSFRGSVTAYATALKHELLGVHAGLLAERGAVDGQVAREMAEGVRDRLGADWGVSTTGVAGPEPQDGRPAGTVFVAVAGPDGTVVLPLRLTGGRDEIRRASVVAVLDLLAERLRASADAGAGPGSRSKSDSVSPSATHRDRRPDNGLDRSPGAQDREEDGGKGCVQP